MNNTITASGNVPQDLEILDEMLPCEGATVHFKSIAIADNGKHARHGWKFTVELEINGKPFTWTATSGNSSAAHAADYWDDKNERLKDEARQIGIGEVLDAHYDEIMEAA